MNVVEIINKLNKINVNDLKNIDHVKLLNSIKGRPDILLITAAVAAALLGSCKIVGQSQGEMKSTKEKIRVLEEKVTAIKDYKSSQSQLQEFTSQIPEPVDGDSLMNVLTDFASKRQIKIESFSPSKSRSETLYDTASLQLNVVSEDYKNLWLFIRDIEDSNRPIHIKRLKTSPSAAGSKISVQMEIITVNLKKDG